MISPPFDSIRDYVAALDQRGMLQRFTHVDQDAYEGTAIMYRLVDTLGLRSAPAVMLEHIHANGKNHSGPVLANLQGPAATESLLLGLEPVAGDERATYRQATAKMVALLEGTGGNWPEIEPREVPRDAASCKQVVLSGDAIDLTEWPFLRGNPGDGGAYINTASVFTMDPDLGVILYLSLPGQRPAQDHGDFEHGTPA